MVGDSAGIFMMSWGGKLPALLLPEAAAAGSEGWAEGSAAFAAADGWLEAAAQSKFPRTAVMG